MEDPPEDYWKDSYFEIVDIYFQGELSKLIELMDFEPGMKSLDIGAGIGKQMKVLESAGFDVFGFESSKPFYDRAISKMGITEAQLTIRYDGGD